MGSIEGTKNQIRFVKYSYLSFIVQSKIIISGKASFFVIIHLKLNILLQKKQKNKRKVLNTDSESTSSKQIKLTNGFIVEACTSITPSTTNSASNVNNQSVKNKTESDIKKNKKVKKKIDKHQVLVDNTKSSTAKLNSALNDINASMNNIQTDNKNKVTNNVMKTVHGKKQKLKDKQERVKLKLGEDVQQNVPELTAEDMLTWAEFKLQGPIMKALTELGFKKPTKIQQLSLPAAIHGKYI